MPLQHRVKLTESKREIFVASDETVLDRALDEGLPLPFKCREGTCLTCRARIVSGRLDQQAARALTERQKGDGWVLLCVGRPLSDCVIEK